MSYDGFLLGLDIGSSSVKASLVSVASGQTVASTQSPEQEMSMLSVQSGWAEQDPELWWRHVKLASKKCIQESAIDSHSILGIGIAYQMHGLVLVDKDFNSLRPSIIWCDSRAVEIGSEAFDELGHDYCLRNLLNSPGNFTASKLKWVQKNEPQIYSKIYKVMLPGDFIAMKLTGEIKTTNTGLSEGIFLDYEENDISDLLLGHYGFDRTLFPERVNVFSKQGKVLNSVAHELGLEPGTVVSYRAGDQPNNAFSLNALNPGETAATAGTSGVIYTVTDKNVFDTQSRVNTFLHVTNTIETPRNGVLLCVNGTGILNSWVRKLIGADMSYQAMNELADQSPIGSSGISILPFGNGAERIVANKEVGASIHGLNFNRHNQSHVCRAAQEGIVFALKYGFDILQSIGAGTTVIRAGRANMFLSSVFREAFVNVIGARLELYETDGAKGAALGAGVGAGIFASYAEAFRGLKRIGVEEVDKNKVEPYAEAYHLWKSKLEPA
jgi:xylulokinase